MLQTLTCIMYVYTSFSVSRRIDCYCDHSVDGVSRPPQKCQQNTCSITDTSIGQCYLERKKISGHVILDYSCLEIEASQIDSQGALKKICNTSRTDGNGDTTDTICCDHIDYCNQHIQFAESPQPTPTAESGE